MSSSRERGSDTQLTAARKTSPDERAAAVRLITRSARDDEDREQLLAALGLTDA
ncbi:hypothetical protein ACGFS9_02900 [Streptomyces sp. NPDC048566]|uniref:hypothetical protein n=1 Tax=Streptomyces sp. NPDC048566 TaxID=3365569 RepID=UPI003723AA5A